MLHNSSGLIVDSFRKQCFFSKTWYVWGFTDEEEDVELTSEQGVGTGDAASCCQMKRAQGLQWQWIFSRGICLSLEGNCFLNECYCNCHSLRYSTFSKCKISVNIYKLHEHWSQRKLLTLSAGNSFGKWKGTMMIVVYVSLFLWQ